MRRESINLSRYVFLGLRVMVVAAVEFWREWWECVQGAFGGCCVGLFEGISLHGIINVTLPSVLLLMRRLYEDSADSRPNTTKSIQPTSSIHMYLSLKSAGSLTPVPQPAPNERGNNRPRPRQQIQNARSSKSQWHNLFPQRNLVRHVLSQ